MKVSTYRYIYIHTGRVNPALKLNYRKPQSGVYVIKKENKIVYIGHSKTSLYKTVTRHFQHWDDWRLERTTFVNEIRENRTLFKIRIIFCEPKKAIALEKALIIKHKPEKNINKYFELFSHPEMEKINSEYLENTNYPF